MKKYFVLTLFPGVRGRSWCLLHIRYVNDNTFSQQYHGFKCYEKVRTTTSVQTADIVRRVSFMSWPNKRHKSTQSLHATETEVKCRPSFLSNKILISDWFPVRLFVTWSAITWVFNYRIQHSLLCKTDGILLNLEFCYGYG